MAFFWFLNLFLLFFFNLIVKESNLFCAKIKFVKKNLNKKQNKIKIQRLFSGHKTTINKQTSLHLISQENLIKQKKITSKHINTTDSIPFVSDIPNKNCIQNIV